MLLIIIIKFVLLWFELLVCYGFVHFDGWLVMVTENGNFLFSVGSCKCTHIHTQPSNQCDVDLYALHIFFLNKKNRLLLVVCDCCDSLTATKKKGCQVRKQRDLVCDDNDDDDAAGAVQIINL